MSGISTCWGALLGIAIAGVSVWANCALAQITPDGTLPNNSSVTQEANTSVITGGTQAASNLFHSFKEFSVPTGSTAFFNNGADIQNIITRVTGGSVSNIDGLIRANGAANLFLINPNGMIFGPNARLNIGGSFIGSTASSINFADGTKFSATPSPDKPLLTITAPIGLGMGTNPGEIKVQGPGHDIEFQDIKQQPRLPVNSSVPGLELKSGNTLALVGGKVSLEGGVLKSPAGRVEIGSVASNGTVSLVPVQEGWKLGYSDTPSFGDIQFSGRSLVDATGVGGGAIAVAGKNISLTGESILLADTLGERNGQEISIVGDEISVISSDINSSTFSSGNAGQVKLVANKSILLEDFGGAGTHTQGLGKAGEITLKADSIEVRNNSGLGSRTFDAGNAGRIEVQANSLLIEKESGFGTSSDGKGDAGEINIAVGDFVIRNSAGLSVDAKSTGNGGKINITANSLLIENGSAFASDTQQGSTGQAGEINLNVAGTVEIRNAGMNSSTLGTGNAGKISITANSLLIEDNSTIYNSTENTGNAGEINLNVAGPVVFRNSAGINNNTFGIGNAGKISITANSLLIEDSSGFTSSTENTGQAGEINLNVAGSMEIRNSAGINNNTSGIGNAGKISITANSLLIEDRSGFSNGTEQGSTGQGGEININVAGPLAFRNDAGMDTNTSGTGDAGQITVSAESLEISNVSEIATKTTGSGNAGNLYVRVKTLVLNNDGKLEVESTGSGNAGTLKIVADTIKLDNQSLIDATTTSGNGGDLTLNVANLLLLRRGAQISTTAGTTQAGGNGGNITINAPNGFIVAVPNENSDITANAYTGIGGRVEINASGIYGTQFREKENPLTSDITASSEFGTDGTIEINTPKIDPNSALINFPSIPVDTELAQGCNSPNYAQSSFIITGRGGLPPNPKDILTPDAVQVDWVTLNPNIDNRKSPSVSTPKNSTPQPIVEATGWVFNAKGQVVFTADAPTSPRSSWNKSVECRS